MPEVDVYAPDLSELSHSILLMRGAEAPLGFSVRGMPECFGSSRLSCEAHAAHGSTLSRVLQMESVDGGSRLDLPM